MDQLYQQLGLHLDLQSDTPLYRQLIDQIVAAIESGALPHGTRLPPTRQLSLDLKTHRNTVVRAFSELSERGLLQAHPGRGTFIFAPSQDQAPQNQGFPWAHLMSHASQQGHSHTLLPPTSTPLAADLIDLVRMEPGPELLPVEAFQASLNRTLATLGPQALGYADSQGLERLRLQLCLHLARLGIEASPNDIVVTTGSQQGLDLIARLLVNRGDRFLTEGRTYSGALSVLEAHGARVLSVETDSEGPSLKALEALQGPRVKGLYVMPSSRNPTGAMISQARRQALIDWSLNSGTPLIEDDYASELYLEEGPRLPALRSLSPEVLYLGSFSKTLFPALRVGFVLCPPSLSEALGRLKHSMDLGTSPLLQHALADFLEQGHFQAHLRQVRSHYRARRDALVQGLRQHLPQGCTFTTPQAGMSLWLGLPEKVSAPQAFELARQAGVLVAPGSAYSPEGSSSGLRLTYAYERPERLLEGAKRLGLVLSLALQSPTSRGPKWLGA